VELFAKDKDQTEGFSSQILDDTMGISVGSCLIKWGSFKLRPKASKKPELVNGE